ncbi:hypothetical protein [Treponema sp. R6D11]
MSQWELEQVSKYPEMKLFIEKLKDMIEKHPEKGLPDSFLSVKGKSVPFLKQSVNLSLFPHQYALGYNFITAFYVCNNTEILIIDLHFS